MALQSGQVTLFPAIVPGQPVNIPENTELIFSLAFGIPALSVGSYQLVIELRDSAGTPMDTSVLDINAQALVPVNQAPFIAIAAISPVTLPNNGSLSSEVTDDGLPVGSIVTHLWSVLSVPLGETATVTDPTALNTTVSFSGPGDYVVGFTASDSDKSTSQQLTITVNPELPPQLILVASASGPTIT